MSFDSHLVVSHVVATAIMSPRAPTAGGVIARKQTQSSSNVTRSKFWQRVARKELLTMLGVSRYLPNPSGDNRMCGSKSVPCSRARPPSAGRSLRSAGRDTARFTDDRGRRRSVTLDEAGTIDFGHLQAFREPAAYRGQRNFPGWWWWSVTTREHVLYESWLERHHVHPDPPHRTHLLVIGSVFTTMASLGFACMW